MGRAGKWGSLKSGFVYCLSVRLACLLFSLFLSLLFFSVHVCAQFESLFSLYLVLPICMSVLLGFGVLALRWG